MKFKVETDPAVYDGFIRDCSSLERSYPAVAVVGEGPKYCFFVSEEEFSKVVNLKTLILYDDYVFIMWRWEWKEEVHSRFTPSNYICVVDWEKGSLESCGQF